MPLVLSTSWSRLRVHFDIRNNPLLPSEAIEMPDLRLPRSVQAVYLRPLRRQAAYGIPSCDLQLRSYSIRNLEFFADFALRAAYYLELPAYGPVPLPQIIERWTVPRSNFIFKKSQENFERKTLRRLIQIRDGHPETVQMWLAFLRKHAYYAVGMKANVWEFEMLGRCRTTTAWYGLTDFQVWAKPWMLAWNNRRVCWSPGGRVLGGTRTLTPRRKWLSY